MTFKERLSALLVTGAITELDEDIYLVKKSFGTQPDGTSINKRELRRLLRENPMKQIGLCKTCRSVRTITFREGTAIEGNLCSECDHCLLCREYCPKCECCIRCLHAQGTRLTEAGICDECAPPEEEVES